MACGSSGGAGSDARALQQQQQASIDQGTTQVNSIFGQFDPKFYQNRAQAYVNYAMPQLQQQYGQQQKGLDYRLYAQGLQKSSAARDLSNQLDQQRVLQTQNITNQGQQQAQDLQRTLTSEQANVLGQLQSSANPSTAAQQALSYASNAQAPSTFAPLGQLFTGLGQQYAAGQQNNLANQYMQALGYNPALTQMLGFGTAQPNYGIIK